MVESLRRLRWGRCLAAAVLKPRLRTLLTGSRYTAIYWRHCCVLAVAVPLCPTLLCRRVVAVGHVAMASAAVVGTALRSRRYCTRVTGNSARRSGCLTVVADTTVSCGVAYTVIAKLAIVLYCFC